MRGADAGAQLFLAPIAPRGTNFEEMPGMARPFGKYFGRLPESNFHEWHKHFREIGEQARSPAPCAQESQLLSPRRWA